MRDGGEENKFKYRFLIQLVTSVLIKEKLVVHIVNG